MATNEKAKQHLNLIVLSCASEAMTCRGSKFQKDLGMLFMDGPDRAKKGIGRARVRGDVGGGEGKGGDARARRSSFSLSRSALGYKVIKGHQT